MLWESGNSKWLRHSPISLARTDRPRVRKKQTCPRELHSQSAQIWLGDHFSLSISLSLSLLPYFSLSISLSLIMNLSIFLSNISSTSPSHKPNRITQILSPQTLQAKQFYPPKKLLIVRKKMNLCSFCLCLNRFILSV